MGGLWEKMKAEAGLPVSCFWDAIWGAGAGGGGADIEYIGAVPFSFEAFKSSLSPAWRLYGAGPYQAATPTPESPVEVQGVGEKTGNLIDIKKIYSPNVFEYIGEEITANDKSFAQTQINLSSYIGKTLTFSAEVKKASNITRAYLRASIGGELIDSKEILKNDEFVFVSITFTPKTINDYVGITYGSGTNTMSARYIMLNEGSEPLPYEPHGYKTTVIDSGKNMINILSEVDNEYYGVKATYQKNNRIRITGVIQRAQNFGVGAVRLREGTLNLELKVGEIYTLSITGRKTNNFYIQINGRDNTETNFALTNLMNGANTRTFKVPAQFVDIEGIFAGIYGAAYGETIDEDITIQLEKNNAATPFEPYREPTTATIYTDEPLFSGDYVGKDSTGGTEHRRWGIKVFDGSESFVRNSAQSEGFETTYLSLINEDEPIINNLGYCSHFNIQPTLWGNDKEGFQLMPTQSSYIRIRINNSIANDAASFKLWLKSEYDAGHPVTIYYQPAAPTDTPKELPDITTVAGYNYIDTDTALKPEQMTLVYKGTKQQAQTDAANMAAYLEILEEV